MSDGAHAAYKDGLDSGRLKNESPVVNMADVFHRYTHAWGGVSTRGNGAVCIMQSTFQTFMIQADNGSRRILRQAYRPA